MGFANFIIGAIILLFGGGLIAFLLGFETIGLVFVITGVAIYFGVILLITYHERKRSGNEKEMK
jgi:uncharacterized membrane protein YdbT with pleckstrin-like domain